MKTALPEPGEFPFLRTFLRGYLGQDYPEIYGDAEAAAAAFLAEASPEEREAVIEEARRLHHRIRDVPVRRLAALLSEGFGSAFWPRRRAELDALFRALDPGTGPPGAWRPSGKAPPRATRGSGGAGPA